MLKIDKEKVFVGLLVVVEAIWLALLFCCCLALVQVITAHAEEPKMIVNGEYVIAEIHTQDNAIEITEPPTHSNTFNTLEALDALEAPPINRLSEALDAVEETPRVYSAITLTQKEADLLKAIMALEGHTEGHDGLKGICEVVFNRVLSPDWPNDIESVIYQRGQFATVKYLKKPYVTPGEAEDDAISEVLRETETTLPSTDYVYFSRGKANGRAFVKINHHWFSR